MPLVNRSFFAQRIWVIGWCQKVTCGCSKGARSLLVRSARWCWSGWALKGRAHSGRSTARTTSRGRTSRSCIGPASTPFEFLCIYSLFESDDAEGFKLLDRLILWSRAEGLYVILDLHAAPGGQTGANIDDSDGYPWLYQSPQEQEHLIAIWRRLATHYRDEPAVLGYYLLNEPIPPFPKLAPLNSSLEPVYKKLSGEIRTVDARHILFRGDAQCDSNF